MARSYEIIAESSKQMYYLQIFMRNDQLKDY